MIEVRDLPVTELFSPEFWQPGTADDHAVLHPLLRRLLLRRLSRRDDTVPPTWAHVYELLRASSSDSRDETDTMYYSLALGDVQYVATRLERSLDNLDASRWLQLLRSVTAAPNQLDHRQSLHQQLAALTRWADPDREPIGSIAQLVATSWICSDPLSASHRQGLYQRMAEHLHTIARYYAGSDAAAFYAADSEYRDAVREYR